VKKRLLVLLLCLSSFFSYIENIASATYIVHGVIDTAKSNRYWESGVAKYELKDYKNALLDFNKSIEYNPDNWEAYRNRGLAETVLLKYTEAIADFTQAIRLNKEDYSSFYGRGEAKRLSEKYTEAEVLEDFNTAIQLIYPEKNILGYYGRANTYIAFGRYKEAISDFTACLSLSDKSMLPTIYYERGKAYLYDQKFKKALTDFNKCKVISGSKDYSLYLYKAEAYYYLYVTGDMQGALGDSAISNYTLYLKSGAPTAGIYNNLATCYGIKMDSVNSRYYFTKSLKLEPGNGLVYQDWAVAEQHFGNILRAKELIDNAFENTSANEKDIDKKYYIRGVISSILKDTAQALSDFKEALQINPYFYTVYESRASLYAKNNRFEEAERDLNSMIAIVKKNVDKAKLYSAQAVVQAQIMNFRKAEVYISKAIELNPNEPFYYILRAMYHSDVVAENFGIADKNRILDDINKAISLDNKMWQSYLIKAGLETYFGDSRTGCENVQRAIELGGIVSKKEKEYICNGKKSEDLSSVYTIIQKQYTDFIPLDPELVAH
jgi:tetratricopeptide (TPR) repeat protein